MTYPTTPGGRSAPNALSDAGARAEVMDPLVAVVRALALEPVFGTFSYVSCDDNGDPPFRGESGGSFTPSAAPDELRRQIVETMVEQGWTSGPGPGRVLYGTSLHRGPMLAMISINDDQARYPGTVGVTILGDCRNYGDHKGNSGTVDIVDELLAVR